MQQAQKQQSRTGEPRKISPEGTDPAKEQQRHPDVDRQNEGIEDPVLVQVILLDMGGLLLQRSGK